MTVKLGDAIVFIRGDKSPLKKDLDGAEKATTTWASKMGRKVVKMAGAAIVAGVGAAAAGAVALAKASVTAFEDTRMALNDVRVSYGETAEEWIRWSKEMQAATTSSDESFQLAATNMRTLIENYGLGENQVRNLIAASADLASVKGLDLTEASERVQSAIRGEAEASEYLGLTLNDTYLKNIAFGGSLRDVWETLDDAEKAQYRYEEALNQMAYAQGEAEAATETWSGMMAQLKNQGQDWLTIIGQQLVPALMSLLPPIKDLVEQYGPMVVEWAQEFGTIITETLGPALIGFTELMLTGINELFNFGTMMKKVVGGAGAAALSFMGMHDEAKLLLNSMGLLNHDMEGWTEITGEAAGEMDVLAESAVDMADSVDEAAYSMEELNTLMAGAVSQENKQYENQMSSIKDRIANVTAELANLKDQQESPFAKTKQEKMLEAQIALQEKVAAEQEKRANTEPGNQAKLELAVLRSTRAYQQKIQAVTEHGKQTEAEATRAAELTAELGTLQSQMVDLETAHSKAMNQIVFDMATAEMAVDGFTEAEQKLAETMAESLGLIDRDTAGMVDGVNRSLAQYDRSGIIEDAISDALRLSNIYRTMPAPSAGGGSSVPRYASGTDFHPGGPAIVGEGKLGGEMVNLPRGSQVISGEQSSQGANIVIYGANFYGVEDSRNMIDELNALAGAMS